MIRAELIQHNGSPAICINGEIIPPMMMTVVTTNKKELLLDQNYFRSWAKAASATSGARARDQI